MIINVNQQELQVRLSHAVGPSDDDLFYALGGILMRVVNGRIPVEVLAPIFIRNQRPYFVKNHQLQWK